MRLFGCLLVELLVAAALLAGTGYAGSLGLGRARTWIEATRARSESATRNGGPRLHRRLDLSGDVAPQVALESSGTFLGMSDELLLERIRTQPVTRLKFNRGGSSLSFRMDFADGSRAAWKPAQTNAQTVPRKEVAAYRLNRLLGLDAVPPAAPRAISKDDLFGLLVPVDAAAFLPRIRAQTIVGPSGMIEGEASYWIPVIKDADLDTPSGHQELQTWLSDGEPVPFERRPFLAQVSTLIVFDFLTANPDRYSGGNMKTSADGSQLYYMDNTMSFFLDAQGTEKNRQVLSKTQRFSKRLCAALPRVDEPTLRRLMRDPDGAEILTEAELHAVVSRRAFVELYVADLVKTLGEAKVLYFP